MWPLERASLSKNKARRILPTYTGISTERAPIPYNSKFLNCCSEKMWKGGCPLFPDFSSLLNSFPDGYLIHFLCSSHNFHHMKRSTCTLHHSTMGNRSSTLFRSSGREHTAASSNKRKRDDDDDSADELLRASKQTLVRQPGIVIVGNNNILPTFSTMPETLLLHVFSFVLNPRSNDTLSVQLALEQTCRRFSALLGKDSTMRLLYKGPPKVEFQYQVEGEREKIFLQRGIRMIRQFQKRHDTLICDYMGGADGVRTIIDKMLIKMEVPRSINEPFIAHETMIGPPSFPENGFKLFLRGDSIAYLTEVVEQHMVSRLTSAMRAAMFRSIPKESHPYPTVDWDDLLFVDTLCESKSGKLHLHVDQECGYELYSYRLSAGDSNRKWQWHKECFAEDIIGAEQQQRMVRAIASRAGIVKLTGGAFDCIAAEILHFMAIIVVHAFEASKSLWCHHENIGAYFDDNVNDYVYAELDDDIDEEDDHSSHSSEQSHDCGVDYSNQPPPPVHFDEEGKQLCVIIPRQIKDAAVRIGMKPLLDDHGWEVGEGRSRDEEEEEAMLMYHESSSEDDSSDEESDDDAEDEDADSNGGSGDDAPEAEEGEVNMSAGEVVEADSVQNLSGAIEETNDENDSGSCSSLSY